MWKNKYVTNFSAVTGVSTVTKALPHLSFTVLSLSFCFLNQGFKSVQNKLSELAPLMETMWSVPQ